MEKEELDEELKFHLITSRLDKIIRLLEQINDKRMRYD